MISRTLQIFMLLAVAVYFVLLFRLLKKRALNLKYTLLWLFSGVLMLMLAVFPQLLNWLSTLLGIYEPTHALFAMVFFCVIIILISLTSIVSKLNDKNKRLVQVIAILEKRVRTLEDGS